MRIRVWLHLTAFPPSVGAFGDRYDITFLEGQVVVVETLEIVQRNGALRRDATSTRIRSLFHSRTRYLGFRKRRIRVARHSIANCRRRRLPGRLASQRDVVAREDADLAVEHALPPVVRVLQQLDLIARLEAQIARLLAAEIVQRRRHRGASDVHERVGGLSASIFGPRTNS